MPNTPELHDNSNQLMLEKYKHLVYLYSIKQGASEFWANNKMKLVSNHALTYYGLIAALITSNYILSPIFEVAAFGEKNVEPPFAAPRELLIGSYKNNGRLIGIESCATISHGIFTPPIQAAFNGPPSEEAIELLKYACDLIGDAIRIKDSYFAPHAICYGESGSPNDHNGVRNDGITKEFFDKLYSEFKMNYRIWVNCERPEDNQSILAFLTFATLYYLSIITTITSGILIAKTLIKDLFTLSSNLTEKFKDWRDRNTHTDNSSDVPVSILSNK